MLWRRSIDRAGSLLAPSCLPSVFPVMFLRLFVAVDRGAECCAIAPVAVEHPLDHLLAPLEVDVDVRRLPALHGDEALEQQPAANGIDRGDAEHVANRTV